jgi:hypothetical protein
VVQEPVDGRGGEGFGHDGVEPGWVQVAGDGQGWTCCVPGVTDMARKPGIPSRVLRRYTLGMAVAPTTTIKVPKDLRARISREAAEQGTTAAGLISTLLDEHEKRGRLRAVGRAYATADSSYAEEIEQWDTLAGDGLSE